MALATEMIFPAGIMAGSNDEKLMKLMLPALEKTAGKENVVLIPAITGAEDFSFFAQEVPGLYFFVGVVPKGKDLKPSETTIHHNSSWTIVRLRQALMP